MFLKTFLPKAIFLFLQGQAFSIRQETDGFRIGQVFDLLDELDDIAPLLATKAIKDLLAGRDAERGGLLFMEGTEAKKIE